MKKSELEKIIKEEVRRCLREQELSSNSEDEEENGLELYYAYVPANLYKGKYYDYGARRIHVAARNEKEVNDVVNTNKQAILAKLDQARIPVGGKTRRLVPRPVEDNVFFRSDYKPKKVSAKFPGDKVSALVMDAGFQRFFVGPNGVLEPA